MDSIKFISQNKNQSDFATELSKRVRLYFKEANISSFGDYRMLVKASFMIGIYLAAFVTLLVVQPPIWMALIIVILMGIGEAGIGMGVMHDACHGSFSKRKWLNDLMSNSMLLLGSNVLNWKIQHNVLHHTYPNVHKWDRDIDTKAMQLVTHQKKTSKLMRYQHFFGPFLYSLMTLVRFVEDFKNLKDYNDIGALKSQGKSYKPAMRSLILTKAIYLGLIIGLPLIFTDYHWWQILVAFLIVHGTASIIMGTVFQMAHIIEGLEEPLPDSEGRIQNQYFVHQMETTANFGRKNGLFSWYIGGLNYQVEHHLFPHISHIHYPKLAVIVEQTAKDYQQTYNCHDSVFAAFKSHIRALKNLGRGERA